MRTIAIALILSLLSACQSLPPSASTSHLWVGKSKQALLDQWGFPNAITTLPNGNTDYRYVRTLTRPFPYPATPDGVIVVGQKGTTIGFALQPNNPQQYITHCFTDFEMTPQNRVHSVQQNGVGCQ